MRRRSIRKYLVQMHLVSVIPIGLFAGALLYLHWQAQDAERVSAQIQTVRLLAAAVDSSLDSTIERLSILARLWASTTVDDEQIHEQAQIALRTNPDWANIIALDANGEPVFRADASFEAGVPIGLQFDLLSSILASEEPLVSDVLTSPGQESHFVAVGVPVIRQAGATHVLIVVLNLDWYDALLNLPGQPEGAVAAIIDRKFKFVARSTEGAERRGQDPTPAFIEDMRREREGLGTYTNLNGTAVYTAWTFTEHGFGVGFATPSAPVNSAFLTYLTVFGLIWAAALGAGFVHAALMARPIVRSLKSLAGQAAHLADGRRIELPESRVTEIQGALAKLESASVLLQDTMAERDRSIATEKEARAAAEQANRAKDEFLAMLGHELRNPLAAIANASALLDSEGVSGYQVRLAGGMIRRQSRHLKGLIDDLLDVGRTMTGKISLHFSTLDLAVAAREAVASLKAAGTLSDRRVELDLRPVRIDGDPTRIAQIISNLLSNAARHTSAGGWIGVRTALESGEAILEISDDGAGIAERDLPRVFELFYQGSPTQDRSAGGLGIGLTLVLRLTKLHGGAVEAASGGPGRGARFTVRLPAVASRDAGEPERRPAVRAASSTVLVVEDNTDARESLSMALELKGFRVLRASDGAAALDLATKEQPDWVLLDIGLPGMDGRELAGKLRAELGAHAVLMAISGYGTRKDVTASTRAGIDRHFVKPVSVDELAAAFAQTQSGRQAS